MKIGLMRVIVNAVIALALMGHAAEAQQLTTATIGGSVTDAQGGALPGATIQLTSETRGTSVPTITTDAGGQFVVPNLAPDTYTMEVQLEGFKTLRRTGIALSGGDRSTVGGLMLELGGIAETVTVTAEASMIQAQSGERSFTVAPKTVESLPIANRSFTSLTALAPGVTAALGGNAAAGIQPQRIGGGGAPNIMMDGVSSMDIAGNRPSLQMNVESIAEVKVVSSSYQAEYGRSAGVQVMAITKSGTNQFHGSVYDVERRSDWNANSQTNILNGDPKPLVNERDWGFSVGGPIGKSNSNNKLFFFFAQEFAPRNAGGDTVRFRVPTQRERAGDFSQSTDNNGNLYNLIRDASTNLPCTGANTAGCFRDGGVLGRIPADRLYQPGVNILKLWPEPNVSVPGAAYNFEMVRPTENHLAWQSALKLDYNAMENLRASFKYSGWMQKVRPVLGTIPGFNDTTMSRPIVDTWASAANYTINNSTFLEATYGRSRMIATGCPVATQGSSAILCRTSLPVTDSANPFNVGLGGLPLLFPDANILDPNTHMAELLGEINTPSFQDGRVLVLPTFAFGSRVANAPPNFSFPGGGGMNSVFSEDLVMSVTKITGRHTYKAGFYYAHATKVQQAAPGSSNASFRGAISFANDANNPFDSTFGFSNAALGVFTSLQQVSGLAEGRNGFRNIEGYLQDTWRLNRLTLDYGLRIIHQQPQHDEANQTTNFLPEQWDPSLAPLLYTAGCANGVSPCSGDNRQARNPATGQFLGPGSSWRVGTIVPNTGDQMNGLYLGGQGISTLGVESPKIRLAPRFGMAYDVSGRQSLVVRGGVGLFYSRGFLNATAANPPFVRDVTVRFNQLQALDSATLPIIPVQLAANEYNMPYPSDVQWSTGVQMLLPFSTGVDVAYVGHHSSDEINNVNILAVDFGTAFLPQFQDRTLTPSAVPGANAVSVPEMSPYRGYSGMNMSLSNGWRTYHSIQLSLNRRFNRGFQFGFVDTISLYDHQHTAPRFEHDASGEIVVRADQAEQDRLLGNLLPVTHIMKGTFLWDLPDLSTDGTARRVIGAVINDWNLAGIWSASTGASYSATYNYASGGTNTNLTGSPDYAARIRVVGDPGRGCGSDALRQFNTQAFAGPQTNSLGLESGSGYLRGCFQSALDLSISRNIQLGGGRLFQFRVDVFNAPNQAIITNRNTTMNLANPATSDVATNLPFDAAGNVIEARARPNGAGFGVATAYQAPRSVQLQLRFQF